MPIRGHSGVQGGAEVGCVPGVDADDARRDGQQVWGFEVPAVPGWTAGEMIDARGRRRRRPVLDRRRQLPRDAGRRGRVASLRSRGPRLRIHQDIVLSSSMLADSDGDVLVLPATTRYESPGGGTETSTERRIIFSPEIPGRRIGSARPEW